MTAIQDWARVICLAGFVSCMVEMLTLSGKMTKIVRMVLGLFMICAMIIPLSKVSFDKLIPELKDNKDNTEISEALQSRTKQDFIESASDRIRMLAEDILNKNSIEYKSINVHINVEEDFNISEISIDVDVKKENIKFENKIKDLIEKELGIKTQVLCS